MKSPLIRLAEYARATGVLFEPVARHAGYESLGLPDVRGFTPHLRTVRRFAGEPPEFPRASDVAAGRVGLDDLETRELWLLHDLAHVIWYDVAAVTFGAGRFAERDFFLEQHLASEAFAVLLLDYHLLASTRHHGLAVELDARAWDDVRARVRGLPELRSYEMARELVAQYLAGDVAAFREPEAHGQRRAGGDAARGADAETLARWRDHERSYSDKQRWYVFLWWDDLALAPLSHRRAEVEDPQIAELVWLVLRLFTSDADPAFDAHVERVRSRLRGVANYFEGLPKYRGEEEGAASGGSSATAASAASPGAPVDFRFTDVLALRKEQIVAALAAARAPSAARLFLLWQLLALEPVGRRSEEERAAIAKLAASVQTTAPDATAWAEVRSLCERIVAGAEWTVRPEARSAFFLP